MVTWPNLSLVNLTNRSSLGTLRGHIRRVWSRHTITRANAPDMPLKRTKKVRLSIYRTQIRPYQVSASVLISQDVKTTDSSDWLIANYGRRKTNGLLEQAFSHFSEDQEVVVGFLQLQAPAVTEEP